MKKTLYLVLILTSTLYNCSNSSSDDLTPNTEEEEEQTVVTYNDDISAIFSSNCIFCHGETPTNGATTSYHTYTLSKNGINGIISRINSETSPMPPRGLMAQDLRDAVQDWKDSGLLED